MVSMYGKYGKQGSLMVCKMYHNDVNVEFCTTRSYQGSHMVCKYGKYGKDPLNAIWYVSCIIISWDLYDK